MAQRRQHNPVGYGADRRSSGFYVAIAAGVILALFAVVGAVGWFGSEPGVQANNPSVETTGQGEDSKATVPGAGEKGKERPGGNWDRRFN
jgi:hypothetical protein